MEKIINKSSKLQVWDEDHNDHVDLYAHGFIYVELTLNFYNGIKFWSLDRTSFIKDKHYKKKFLNVFVNIYYFNNKEDYKLQDASFTELRLKKTGKCLSDFVVEFNKLEKFIRINKAYGTIKENTRVARNKK